VKKLRFDQEGDVMETEGVHEQCKLMGSTICGVGIRDEDGIQCNTNLAIVNFQASGITRYATQKFSLPLTPARCVEKNIIT